MKILHIIPSVAARDGGPNRAVRSMAEGLVHLDHEVVVATTDADGPGRLDVPLHSPVMENGVEYRFFGRSLLVGWKFSYGLSCWLASHTSDFDVVHVHALFSYATIPGCRFAARSGVPYILRPLGTLSGWGLRHGVWKKAPYLRLVERPHLADAAAIHVTSVEEACSVTALGYGGKVRLIPLGVDPRILAASHRSVRPVDSPAATTKVLFLSRLHPIKGLPLLISALEELRANGAAPIDLTIAGSGDAEYERQLRQLCDRAGITPSVHFTGFVEGQEKQRLLAATDLFVLPSYSENFGIAVVEAMAMGLPVIISDQVGVAPDVNEAGAGIVVPCDAAALAGAVARLASDAAMRHTMGVRARALVEERFSWERTCRALDELYAELTIFQSPAYAT